MFKYKTEAELSAMTSEQRDIYSEQKRAWEATQTKAQIDAALAEFKTANMPVAETEEEKTARLAAEKAKEDRLKELEENVQQFKENGGGNSPASDNVAKQLKENKERLSVLARTKTGVTAGFVNKYDIVIKADTLRASIATNNHYLQIGGIGQLGRVEVGIYDICTKYPVSKGNHNGTIAYTDWDEDTTVKNAAAVAEGVAFNESTAKFKGYTLPLRKIGDTLPVSEEFFEDEEMAAGELRGFIQTNVACARDTELITGDNTGQHLKGLVTSVPTYTAIAAGIPNVNIYDLITKMKTTITKNRGSKYTQFYAVMNQDTADKLVLQKDANDNYQFPPNHPIWSTVRIDNNMANNKLVVGDFRYARIYEMGGIVLSSGTTDTQFAEDLMTLKARLRLAFLIRTVDQTGFLLSSNVTADMQTIEGT